jgi:hypothetical protein
MKIRFIERMASETTQIWGRSSQAACDPWGVGTPLFLFFRQKFGEAVTDGFEEETAHPLPPIFLHEPHLRNAPFSAVARPSLNPRIDREVLQASFLSVSACRSGKQIRHRIL